MEKLNHEYYVSLEVAKLLKEAGFEWKCRKIYYCYHEDNDTWELEDNYKNHQSILELDYCLLAPTLEFAQRWLREINGQLIYLVPAVYDYEEERIKNEDYKWICWNLDTTNFTELNLHPVFATKSYDTYEEALEAGVKKALEIILEKGKII